MFDFLLESSVQSAIRRRWWVAVISGAIAGVLFVTLLHFTGVLPT